MTVFPAAPREGRSAAASSTSTATASARSPSSATGSSPHGDDDLPWERLDSASTPSTSPAATTARCAQARRARQGSSRRRAPTTRCATPASSSTRSCARPRTRASSRPRSDLDPPPDLVVSTAGKEGGEWVGSDHKHNHWKAAELPGPRRDAYGAGDSFAAGLTYALAAGHGTGGGAAARGPRRRAQDRPAAPPTTTSSRLTNSEHGRALDACRPGGARVPPRRPRARTPARSCARDLCGASSRNSWASARVRLATERSTRSSHRIAVRERRDVGHVDPGAHDDAARRRGAQRRGDELAGRGEDDRRVERLRAERHRVAGPLGAEATSRAAARPRRRRA